MRNSLIPLLLLFPVANGMAAENHCSHGETVIFSCSVGKGAKVVSICASRALSAQSGTLYYRFGAPSSIELEYPSKPNGAARKFRHAHYSRYQTDRTELTFAIGSTTYAVFNYYEESENPKYRRGVRVSAEGAESHELILGCKGAVTSNLRQLEGIVPCDVGSALAQCN